MFLSFSRNVHQVIIITITNFQVGGGIPVRQEPLQAQHEAFARVSRRRRRHKRRVAGRRRGAGGARRGPPARRRRPPRGRRAAAARALRDADEGAQAGGGGRGQGGQGPGGLEDGGGQEQEAQPRVREGQREAAGLHAGRQVRGKMT